MALSDADLLEGSALVHSGGRVRSDWLFLERLARWVRPGGYAVVVLPWTIAGNPSAEPVRALVARDFAVRKVVGLPEGVFRPFGGAAGRAMVVVLEHGGAGEGAFSEVTDVGWDPTSRRFKATPGQPRAWLREQRAWRRLEEGAWLPAEVRARGVPLSTLAEVVHRHTKPRRDLRGAVWTADLSDGDRRTGELRPRRVQAEDITGPRQLLEPGDILVGRLRPELGNVVSVPRALTGTVVGTPEWIAVRGHRYTGWLLHALRTPAWRESLPHTTGQTRPRTTLEAVRGTSLPWPGDALASRVDALSTRIRSVRAREEARLLALQRAVDDWSAGDLDDEGFARLLDALEESRG